MDSKHGWRKGPWTAEEDGLLVGYVTQFGEGRWSYVSKCTAGLNRSGKSCRLRWVNYLRPGLKKGHITPQEEGIIIELHALWGNKWSTIARYLPGRTDNEIKNYWRTHFKKRKQDHQHKLSTLGKKQGKEQKNELESRLDDQEKMKFKMEEEVKKENLSQSLMNVHNEDSIPIDHNYLWGGLWSFDDQNGCRGIQNHIANWYPDAIDFMFSGGNYIF